MYIGSIAPNLKKVLALELLTELKMNKKLAIIELDFKNLVAPGDETGVNSLTVIFF